MHLTRTMFPGDFSAQQRAYFALICITIIIAIVSWGFALRQIAVSFIVVVVVCLGWKGWFMVRKPFAASHPGALLIHDHLERGHEVSVERVVDGTFIEN